MKSVYLRGSEAPLNPRIFKKRIRRAEDGIRPGEIVVLRTEDDRFVGRGFFNPRSVIAMRILDRDERGPPIDARWFADRLRSAVDLRRNVLRLDEVTDAYRVVFAEGDGLPGLIADQYADVLVIEVGTRGIFERLDDIEEALRSLLGVARVVVRADPKVEEIEGFSATDRRAPPVETVVVEHGVKYHVDCTGGHKTGFFIDQREARAEVMRLSRGRSVLDLCCYTGGFALAAAKGGAASVRGVDLDENAVAVAKRNAHLNGLRVDFDHGDAFDVLRDGVDADLVVLDPPKLTTRRKDVPRAWRKSIDFNRLALAALPPGGLLFTFTCTGMFSEADFAAQVRDAATLAGRSARVLRVTGQPPDHPVHVHCPESRYLSGLLLQVE